MSIKRLPDGKWLVDVSNGRGVDGNQARIRKRFESKRDAELFQAKALVGQGVDMTGSSITLGDFIETFFWSSRQLRDNTKSGYARDFRRSIIPALGHVSLKEINHQKIQGMLLSCSTKKTAQTARETLSSVMSCAVELGFLASNPCAGRYRYPEKRVHEPSRYGDVITTFADMKPVLECVHDIQPCSTAEKILVLGLCFGLRKGEIFGLDWECVNIVDGYIEIVQTYTKGQGGAHLTEPKTKNARRRIPMNSLAYDRISSWPKGSGAVIKTQAGNRMHPDSGTKALRTFLCKAKTLGYDLPSVTIHTLRHSFGTSCVNAGIQVSKISKMMGHHNISITIDRYVKHSAADLQSEMETINKFLC